MADKKSGLEFTNFFNRLRIALGLEFKATDIEIAEKLNISYAALQKNKQRKAFWPLIEAAYKATNANLSVDYLLGLHGFSSPSFFSEIEGEMLAMLQKANKYAGRKRKNELRECLCLIKNRLMLYSAIEELDLTTFEIDAWKFMIDFATLLKPHADEAREKYQRFWQKDSDSGATFIFFQKLNKLQPPSSFAGALRSFTNFLTRYFSEAKIAEDADLKFAYQKILTHFNAATDRDVFIFVSDIHLVLQHDLVKSWYIDPVYQIPF
jgi:transcriptional regulator with XRE-family HTH domain